jgi:mevalonate kinase
MSVLLGEGPSNRLMIRALALATAPAKWVLAGEHSVLRGGEAIALPYPELQLRLLLRDGGTRGSPVTQVIREVLKQRAFPERAPDLWQSIEKLDFAVESQIPQSSGLGSSAALSVAIARFSLALLEQVAPKKDGLCDPVINDESVFSLAIEVEKKFQGVTSGMDVAAILSSQPIRFHRLHGATPLKIQKLPQFTLHDSQLRSQTAVQIQCVDSLRSRAPGLGDRLDSEMAEAVAEALDGLLDFSDGNLEEAYALLTRSMERSSDCFEQWGLVPREVRALQRRLRDEGALATRLTGSGGGGFVVALWK